MLVPISIRCLLTGGTIDNRYHQQLGKMVVANNVEKIVKHLRLPHHQISCQRLFKIDSKDMTSEHRSQIVMIIRQSQESKIIITHGTDTLVETAGYLLKAMTGDERKQKTVILTGAMVPYGVTEVSGTISQSRGEDAQANLVSAIALMGMINSGVWIVFHGRILHPRRAYKDYTKLTFFEK